MGGLFRLISEKKVQQKLFHISLQGLKQLAGNERDAFNSSAFGFPRSSFSNDVKELINRIRNVLVSTQQMKEHEDDPEKFVDLQHVMAQSYCDSPEHRKTWLEQMANKHRKVFNDVTRVAINYLWYSSNKIRDFVFLPLGYFLNKRVQ